MKINFDDIENGFLFTSMGPDSGNTVTLNKETGEMYYQSEYGDSDELPDDIDDDVLIDLPDKNELELGKRLVFRFVSAFMPEKIDKVKEIFSKKGAYATFKELLECEEILDEWHVYENEARRKALKEWCEDNDIEVSD
jgi:Uncharacterised protein family (UPF0158)